MNHKNLIAQIRIAIASSESFQEEWQNFQEAFFAEDISDDDIAILEQMFYAGAYTLLKMIQESPARDLSLSILSEELSHYISSTFIESDDDPTDLIPSDH